jgi:predicted nucleic acid-binding protein
MKDPIYIDASVFLSKYFLHESSHSITKHFFDQIEVSKTPIILSILTIFEVLQSFFRINQDRSQTDQIHQEFIDLHIAGILVITALEAEFLSHFTANHHLFNLKTSDTIVALSAHSHNCPLITWDKQLIKSCRPNIDALTPEEFLKR